MASIKLTYETKITIEVETADELAGAVAAMGLQGVKPIGFTSAQSNIIAIESKPMLQLTAASAEKQAVIAALEQSGGVKTEAARILDVERQTLYNMIKRHGIET